MTIPNFFLIGASKAGTTSIAQGLAEHPQVFITDPKEPNFFNQYDEDERVNEDALLRYLRLYDGVTDERVVGEASVSSLGSTAAARHIYQFNPDAKVLICLRNPVQRIVSLYEMYVRHGLKESFHHATAVDPWLVNQCQYNEPIKRYLDVFPRDQIFWIDFEDIKNDWSSCMRSIHRFLGVSEIATSKPILRNTGGMPASKLSSVVVNRRLIEIGKCVVPRPWRNSIDRKIKLAMYKKFTLSKDEGNRLRRCFLPDVQRVDELLSTDYARRWGLLQDQRIEA